MVSSCPAGPLLIHLRISGGADLATLQRRIALFHLAALIAGKRKARAECGAAVFVLRRGVDASRVSVVRDWAWRHMQSWQTQRDHQDSGFMPQERYGRSRQCSLQS